MTAYRKLQVWSVAVASQSDDGYPTQIDLADAREPTAEEKASHDFCIGKVLGGRSQLVSTVGPWVDDKHEVDKSW